LSKLLNQAAREPLQVEVSAVWVLFELLGFLLKLKEGVSFQPSDLSLNLPVHFGDCAFFFELSLLP